MAIKILVVNGGRDAREIYRLLLERHGYSVRTAEDGTSAAAAILDDPPHLVITEYAWHVRGGEQLVWAIQSTVHPGGDPIRVLILTSRSYPGGERDLALPEDGYLLKPVPISVLLAMVAGLVGTPDTGPEPESPLPASS